ncbi:hypothetical protein BC349_08235 [Flavihumibacter stibioxidans]|uniref:Glycosyltransferase n=1 Tax=Flavihumibacter stibioxidans TaxID=1834163 RepID=A0ABR7M7I7_9BACT|nr:hypothetical protein [Flavihumibacter stibioxidans]
MLGAFGIDSEVWFPANSVTSIPGQITIPAYPLESLTISYLKSLIHSRQLDTANDIIVTHGCWQFATHWGAFLKKLGYKWIYVPHGMLEPWPLQHKKWKKKLYLKFFERRMILKADLIRAVSSSEAQNLKKLFPAKNVILVPNGVECESEFKVIKENTPMIFVFMARLHQKKGIVHLVNAWLRSSLNNDSGYQLLIAGPDEGELPLIEPLIKKTNNIRYVGVVKGSSRDELLASAHFYVLPSYSEGFPTSVIEAMEKGAIPLISRECNFNEAFDAGLAIDVKPDPAVIAPVLEKVATTAREEIALKGAACYQFIKAGYSLEQIAALQKFVYLELLQDV